MNVTVFSDFRCAHDADGNICTTISIQPYSFWTRYLDVFDHVTVVARLADRTVAGPAVTGPGVSFYGVPDYTSATQYLARLALVRRSLADVCQTDSAFILRVPGRLGTLAAAELRRTGKPYGVEVVGDPWDVFVPGAVRHPLRPILRRLFTADLKRVARHAAAAAYVTAHALQRAYPCPAFQLGVSDVELAPSAFAPDWKHARADQTSFRMVMVGTLAQLYKAPDVLLDALALVVARGVNVSVVFIGDGQFRPELEARAAALGLQDRAIFRGQLAAGAAVRAELDAADLFVLPSRGGEGLPRAIIEAMARGLPCISTRVGGIPELLNSEDLATPDQPADLAALIEAVLTQPERREVMAARCWARAHDFGEARLLERRRRFFHEVQARTKRVAPCRPRSGTSSAGRSAVAWRPDRSGPRPPLFRPRS